MMMVQGSTGKGRELGGAQMPTSGSKRHAGSENAFPWFNCIVWWNLIILAVLSIYCLYVVLCPYTLGRYV